MTLSDVENLLVKAAELQTRGQADKAKLIYEEVLSLDPANSDALHLLGLLAHQMGDPRSAADLILRAIEISPAAALFHFHLGVVLVACGDLDGACKAYARAISFQPGYPEAYYNLGRIFELQGVTATAQKCFEAALRSKPDFTDARTNLGNLAKREGRLDEACAHYLRALEADPACYEASNNLGNISLRQGKLETAVEWYRRALEMKPGAADPGNNLGSALMRLGRFEEAHRQLSAVISHNPDHAGAHFNMAWLLLLTGRFESGWDEYEWRLKVEGYSNATHRWLESTHRMVWTGGPIAGKTILVYCEQGLGDSIQFVRHLPLLKARGCRIIFSVQKELLSLFAGMPGPDFILGQRDDGLIEEPFDERIPLLSLPRLMHSTASNIPAVVPYLGVSPGAADGWRARIGTGGFKVGLVWAGRPTNSEDWRRSCALSDFAPLAGIPGIQLFGLQKGPAANEAESPPPGLDLRNLGPDLLDFQDTAAAILNLDLVITVDTAVAHLTGALAKPVWTILPHFPEWRWLLERTDSPWYPTMRLYRQQAPGDWRGVIERIAADLVSEANSSMR